MTASTAKVSIGVPVYNGEVFLVAALDSVLAQTLTEIEVIISDNASTDRTEAICRAYAERDERVRYIRHEENRGASWNHTFVALEARAPYFKWAAADDICEPTYLERCVAVLDSDPSAVLCQPQTMEIDDAGEELRPYFHNLRVTSEDMLDRWTDLLNIGYACYDVYGVIRTEALFETGLMGTFIESDAVLLAELSLHGRFAEVPERLFRHRIHPGQSVLVHVDRYDRAEWFDTSKSGFFSFPTWRFALEYVRAVRRGNLRATARWAAYRAEAEWALAFWRHFARDLKRAWLRWAARLSAARADGSA